MSKPNTPAGDYWTLYVAYSDLQQPSPQTRLAISFLPTGEIDVAHTPTSNLTKANTLLAPTIEIMQESLGEPTFDIWRFFNWVMVTNYWGLLADLGQIAPTACDLTVPPTTYGAPGPIPQPVPFPSTNNIFINETLFQGYFDYYNSTLSPAIQVFIGAQPPPVLLNDETRLEPIETTLLRSYTCSNRQIKSPLDLIIAVLVADYALIMGAYKIILFITGWLQKRKDDAGIKFKR